jgi:hypothetical protein
MAQWERVFGTEVRYSRTEGGGEGVGQEGLDGREGLRPPRRLMPKDTTAERFSSMMVIAGIPGSVPVFSLRNEAVQGLKTHRYHRNGAILLHRPKEHPKGLAYVLVPMIVGPLH